MKAIHFTYWITVKKERFLHDLRSLLKTFSEIKDEEFRKSFHTLDGENLLLYGLEKDVYLFVVTKDKELIKAISSTTLMQESIMKKLAKNEHVGFGSYVYMGQHSYSIASTFHGPKQRKWDQFINDLLTRIGKGDLNFYSTPIKTSVTKTEAMRFAFKSSIKMQLRKNHPICTQFSHLFGSDPETGEMEIVIKPVKSGQLSLAWDSVFDHIADQDVKKIMIRGRENITDELSDFYVVGSGHACDAIDSITESGIISALKGKAAANLLIREAINELKSDNLYSKDHLPGNADLADISRWPTNILGKPMA